MKIESVAIVGSGLMGAGVAQVFAQSARNVLLCARTIHSGNAAVERIKRSLKRGVEKGGLNAAEVPDILSRIRVCSHLGDVGGVDLILEAVSESFDVKERVLVGLAEVAREGAIIASNTSSISITKLAAVLPRPQRFIGLHFFNPAPAMRLVEVVSGLLTDQQTIDQCVELVRSMSKTAVVVRNSPGFVVNRMLCPMLNEAFFVMAEGVAAPEEIDEAMIAGCNHPIGPLALADLIGLDTLLSIMEVLWAETGDPKYRPAPKLREFVAAGLLGKKTGRGVYEY